MMRDLNFFSKYHVAPAKTSPVRLALISATVVALLAVLGAIGFLYVENDRLQTAIADNEYRLQSPELTEGLNAVSDTEKDIASVKNDQVIFSSLEGDFKRIHRVNKAFMDFLNRRVTRNLVFENVEIQHDKVVITGFSTERLSIAKFEEELRKTDKFNHILVSEIKLKEEEDLKTDEKVYEFNMEIETKDVDFNE